MVPSAPFLRPTRTIPSRSSSAPFLGPGAFSRHLPRALASGARSLQPSATARCSSTHIGVGKRTPGARGLQPGAAARCSSTRIGVAKRWARGEVFLRCESACARARSAVRSSARRRAKFSSAARRGLQPGDVRSSLRRAPVGEGAEAHDLQSGAVFGVSAWAKARRPAGSQTGVVAMCSSVRVGVAEARWPG